MKIIVAPDSFKGSLTAVQAAKAMEAGILDYDPAIQTVLLPAADGGEGTMSSLIGATGGKLTTVLVQDPLGRPIEASYGVLGDEETCIVEIAEASGLMLLSESELNPLKTSSFGTGELILHALNAGYRKFIIGLGGSATNDGGVGMLQALGIQFLNQKGIELPLGGGALGDLYTIDCSGLDKRISKSSFIIACDVENPFVGSEGASAVFGPQKGATESMIKVLDTNLTKFADVVQELTGKELHAQKGAGAAGGAGGAFLAFFPCEMKPGIEVVLQAISFDDHLKGADLVLTGEGKTDVQTLSGKTPFGIAQAARKEGKPVLLISGTLDQTSRTQLSPFFTELHAITDETISTKDSIENAFDYLQLKTQHILRSYLER